MDFIPPPNLESTSGSSPPFGLLFLPASPSIRSFSLPLFSILPFLMLYPPFPPRSLTALSLPSEKFGRVLLRVLTAQCKNRGEVSIYSLNKTSPIFFTRRKLRPPPGFSHLRFLTLSFLSPSRESRCKLGHDLFCPRGPHPCV